MLVVIGSGPGGYVSALKAANNGIKTILIEKDIVGGTCLNYGCIPTKAIISSAHLYEKMKKSHEFGIKTGSVDIDINAVFKRKENIVSTLRKGILSLVKSYKIELIESEAIFDNGKVIVREKSGEIREIVPKNTIIATGSKPKELPFLKFNNKNILSSNEILEFNGDFPESITIIGGGVIGIEFAYFLSVFGTKVTVVEALPNILPGFDVKMVKRLQADLKKHGIKIHTSTKIQDVNITDEMVTLKTDKGDIQSKYVLLAVGRSPNIGNINNVNVNNGFIEVNKYLQTSLQGVFAIGDCTNRMMLAHFASHQGEYVVEHILNKKTHEYQSGIIPSCVFSSLTLASAGETEESLKQKGINYNIGSFNYRASSMGIASGEIDGIIKILTYDDGKILGAHILGYSAENLIHELALAMNRGISAYEIADIIHAHPTMSEIIMEASADTFSQAIHKYYRK